MTATFFMGGCEEGSYSFEHNSSVEVSTSGGVNYSTSYTETRSENGLLTYKLNDVNLLEGKTEFRLSITNNGSRDTTLNAITINFKATDDKKNMIREGNCDFTNLAISLPKDKEIYETFVIEDANWKTYAKTFNISCDILNVIVNPAVE